MDFEDDHEAKAQANAEKRPVEEEGQKSSGRQGPRRLD
jgi:hypothetical protein